MEIQIQATNDMRERFQHYNLELEEVLIGTPKAMEANQENVEMILAQLRNRQIAKEQMTTFEQQQAAAIKERNLNEARAEAQKELTQSQINIQVNKNQGKAELAKAKQDAESIKTLARAEGEKASTIGDGH